MLEKKSVIVSDLAAMFGVTEETIRRDLKALEEEGVLNRTYGGAYVLDGVENEVNLKIRETIYIESKKNIASKAIKEIQNGDSIFLDNSTTAYYLALLLKDMRLTVLTNSLKITNALCEKDNIKLITIGGRYHKENDAFYGLATVTALAQYNVDKAFISCRSLSMQKGISDSVEELANLRQSVIKRSNKVYMIADYSKFDKNSFINTCTFDDIHVVITDKPLSDQWHEFLDTNRVQYLD